MHPQMDERSAGFQALGLALGTRKPVALICTSGTAVLNYGPAIAEAFYQQVPLLVLTADRPPESIDQWEGQAIRQRGVFENHTKYWAEFPTSDSSIEAQKHSFQIMERAFFEATSFPPGPVHLNIPFREPFYPDGGDSNIDWKKKGNSNLLFTRPDGKLNSESFHRLAEIFTASEKRMVLVGQHLPDASLHNSLFALADYGHVVILGDFLNNIYEIKGTVTAFDWASEDSWSKDFFPDILITTGTGILSKKLKKRLKANAPMHHWHVCPSGFPGNPMGTITEVIHCNPAWFLAKLAEAVYFQNPKTQEKARLFQVSWVDRQIELSKRLEGQLETEEWSDFQAVFKLVNALPSHTRFFVGNSMPVRYWNALSHRLRKGMEAYGNRGTSGIDGCISTAVGLATALPDQLFIVLVGDISFFYDRNGLWQRVLPNNLKIMVLNNSGGNIFRILPDSGSLPELEDWFEMHQPLNAKNAAQEFGLAYFSANNKENADVAMKVWLAHPGPALMECFTDKMVNHQVYINCQTACHEP